MNTILIAVAKSIATNLGKYGYEKLIKNKASLYEQELYQVIQKTISKYENVYPELETERIPFYKSQTLLEVCLEFRFTKDFDINKVKTAIVNDPRIIPPKSSDLEQFLAFFDIEIVESKLLKKLNIESNYKEEIFHISEKLTETTNKILESISDLKNEFRAANISTELLEEWNIQLEEIHEELKSFKAFSAQKRLEGLEKRISDIGLINNKLDAKLLSLKSSAMDLSGDIDIYEDHAKLIIKIYKLQPLNEEYKSNAAQSYFVLGEKEKANELADELLAKNEFSAIAWMIKIFIADSEYEKILVAIPKNVRNQNIFRMHFYRWISHKKLIQKYAQLADLNLHFDIDFAKAPIVTYQNIRYQTIVIGYLLAGFFQRNPMITISMHYKNVDQDVEFNYLFNLLKQLKDKIYNTEVAEGYQFYFFYYYYCAYILNKKRDNILLMEEAFNLTKSKGKEFVVHALQGILTYDTPEYDNKALTIIEEFGDTNDELMLLFKANIYGILQKKDKLVETFLLYLEVEPIWDRRLFTNFILFVRTQVKEIPHNYKEEVEKALNKKLFSKEAYKFLFKVFCFTTLNIGEYSVDEILEFLEFSKKEIEVEEDHQFVYEIALQYCLIDKSQLAKIYLSPIVNTKEQSEILKLYCKILFNNEGDKIELLDILQYWRENFIPDFEIFLMESDLCRLQHNWPKAVIVAKKAMISFPDAEFFIQAYFVALKCDFKKTEILENAYLIEDKIFKDESLAINIAVALDYGGAHFESIDFLYRHAVNPENQQSRHRYLQMFLFSPDKKEQTIERAAAGSFVKYEIGKKEAMIELTDINISSEPAVHFYNKQAGDTFPFKILLTGVITQVTILKIFDKYTALFDELMIEAENPLMGHPLQKFKFDDTSPEGMQKTFIDTFGAMGSLEQDRVNEEFNHYDNFKNSFTEITLNVFKSHFIDAYYNLTNRNDFPFLAIPKVVSEGVQIADETRFVLDFTSICLFYDLSKRQIISFNEKFYISPLVREQAATYLNDALSQPVSRMSAVITSEGFQPHFYDKGFNDRRVNLMQDILEWIDLNCILIEVPERLNIITGDKGDEPITGIFINMLVDLNILANREGFIMLTNDVFHYRHFKGGTHKFIPPTIYLKKYFPDAFSDSISFMASQNYLGIPITFELLAQELEKQILGKENKFNLCLDNLNFTRNPDINHVEEVVKFLKFLYLEKVLSDVLRDSIVIKLFKNIVTGMPTLLVSKLFQSLMKSFNLMGMKADNIRQLFAIAINELKLNS